MCFPQSGGLTQNIRVDSLLGALAGNIAETCRDALAGGELCVLAVADEWSTEQIDEFKAIVEQVTKVSFSSSEYSVFERIMVSEFTSYCQTFFSLNTVTTLNKTPLKSIKKVTKKATIDKLNHIYQF